MSILIRTSRGKARGVARISADMNRTGASLLKSTKVGNVLDIMDSMYVVPYMMTTGSTVGRGAIGSGFDIVRVPNNDTGTEIEKRTLLNFFNYTPQEMTNFKDMFGPLAKLYTTALSFRSFGVAAWEIIRDEEGDAVGFDYIPGLVEPHTDGVGNFKSPAYHQYLRSGNSEIKHPIVRPSDVVYFAVPDFRAGVFLTESESLTDFTLPSEIYAARAYLSLHENRTTPYQGFWYTPETVDDDTFDAFEALLASKYKGSDNYGKSPILMRGKGGFQYIGPPHDDAPYQEGREINRKEISSVIGVPGAKYGHTDGVNMSGMKEIRREFYESVLRPVSAMIEEAIYAQVCLREFGISGWKFAFGRPDFTTALEDASISMRRVQWGEWSPNESRTARGELPREDGDYYLVPKNMGLMWPGEGRPADDPVGEDDGDLEPEEESPVPDSIPPEKVENMLAELRQWKTFELRVALGKRNKRPFVVEALGSELGDFITSLLDGSGRTEEEVRDIFGSIEEAVILGE